MEPRQQRFSPSYFLIAVVAILLIRWLVFAPHQETLAYSGFKSLLRAGKLTEALVDEQTVTGALNSLCSPTSPPAPRTTSSGRQISPGTW